MVESDEELQIEENEDENKLGYFGAVTLRSPEFPLYEPRVWLDIKKDTVRETSENEESLRQKLIENMCRSLENLEKLKKLLEAIKEFEEIEDYLDGPPAFWIRYYGCDLEIDSEYCSSVTEVFGVDDIEQIYEMKPLEIVDRLLAWQEKELNKIKETN